MSQFEIPNTRDIFIKKKLLSTNYKLQLQKLLTLLEFCTEINILKTKHRVCILRFFIENNDMYNK